MCVERSEGERAIRDQCDLEAEVIQVITTPVLEKDTQHPSQHECGGGGHLRHVLITVQLGNIGEDTSFKVFIQFYPSELEVGECLIVGVCGGGFRCRYYFNQVKVSRIRIQEESAEHDIYHD